MRVGILGGGQLGRMLALAGYPLGVRTTVLDPSWDPCAAQVCSHIRGDFDDYQALYHLVKASDVVTYEFENVPVETARWLAERVPVHPPPRALEMSQDRLTEKNFFRDAGIPVPPFTAVDTRADFDAAVTSVGVPAVMKTRRFGYDGKGQAVLRTRDEADAAWQMLGGRPLILEQLVAFDRELSLIAVRGKNGATVFYPLVQNEHRDGMLHRTLAPAPNVAMELQRQAEAYAERVLTALDYVGVLAIEWFAVDGQLLANEMAPRVHNSGHWTTDAAATSQFENHLRAILGWPLGSTAAVTSCEMINLIGTHPPVEEMLRDPAARLHWYGKEPRPRRKIGHITRPRD